MNIASPIAGKLNLQQLRGHLQRYLFDDYLLFLQKYVVDFKYGGFTCSVRPDGQMVSNEKVTWYQGRGLWVYSFLYNHFGHSEEHRRIALAAHQLVERSRPIREDELWPKVLKSDGTPSTPPDSEIYGDLFIAEGLAELSLATSTREYWNQAKEIILKCVRHYDRNDYFPQIGQTYLGPGARTFPGARIGGVWMVLLRSTTQMLRMHEDSELEALSYRSVDALMKHHLNPRFNLFNELIEHDLSRPSNEYAELVYAGHAIEILWMIMDEAIRRGDATLFDRAAQLFRRHCEVATDPIYGGIFRNLKNASTNEWALDKTLFPHQECLIGLLLLIEHRQDAWASHFFTEIYAYTTAKFPMLDIGSPLWQVAGDRYVTRDTNMTRVENYHHPRFLMLSLLSIDRMLKGQ